MLEEIRTEYEKKIGIVSDRKCEHCYVIRRGRYIREAYRDQVVSTRKEVMVPDFALFKAPNYDYLPKVQMVEPKQRYTLRERVAVLSGQYFGCKGWVEELGEKNVKVRLTEDPIKCESRVE